MKKGEKTLFIKHFLKKGYYIPALFFAGIFITALICNLEFMFIWSMGRTMKWFVVACLSYFVALFLVYILSNLQKKHVAISDSICFAILITCVFYLVFMVLFKNNYNLVRICVFGGLLILSVLALAFRSLSYVPDDKQKNITYNKSNLNGYFHSLSRKFTFFGILVFAFFLTCLLFMVLQTLDKLASFIDYKRIVQHLILLSIVVFFIIVSASFRKITLLDAGIVSGLLTSPPILFYILIVPTIAVRNKLLIFFAIALCFIIFLLAIRLLSFSVFNPDKTANKKLKASYKNYFIKYAKKFGWFLTVAIACALALLIVLLSNYWGFSAYIVNGVVNFRICCVIFILALLVGTLFVGFILSLVNFKANDVTYGDFFNVLNIITAFTCLLAFNNTIVKYEIFILLGIIIYSLTILVARIKIISGKN